MALQDGSSLKQDVDQAPSCLEVGAAVQPGERGLCSCTRAMPEQLPGSIHNGSMYGLVSQFGNGMSRWRFKTAARMA